MKIRLLRMAGPAIALSVAIGLGATLTSAAPVHPKAAWQPAYCWLRDYGGAVPCAFVDPDVIDL